MILQLSQDQLNELGAFHTAKEIAQQPGLWKETFALISEKKSQIDAFFEEILTKHDHVRVILTGAGTSAYIGDILVPYLKKVGDRQLFIESIPTTDIVSNPTDYLQAEVPTIMISFARSGNSPESVAAVEIGEKLIHQFYQIVITCNPEGNLAKRSVGTNHTFVIQLPEETNDQGFAMTGSFSSMMLAALLLFDRNSLGQLESTLSSVVQKGQYIIDQQTIELEKIAEVPFKKVVYLGSGAFCGLSREASLKFLELTGGRIPITFDSSLGFRHGPKSILDQDTLVVVFLSNHEYTRKYDLDILREINNDISNATVIAISDSYDAEAEACCDKLLYASAEPASEEEDIYLTFTFILYAQILALKKSILLGFSPDNPSPSGSVNRVVKGVSIYSLS